MSQIMGTGYHGVLFCRPQVSFAGRKGWPAAVPKVFLASGIEVLVELKPSVCMSKNWAVHVDVPLRPRCSSWQHRLCLWRLVPSLCRNRTAQRQLFPDVCALAGWMHVLGAPVRITHKCRLEETWVPPVPPSAISRTNFKALSGCSRPFYTKSFSASSWSHSEILQ